MLTLIIAFMNKAIISVKVFCLFNTVFIIIFYLQKKQFTTFLNTSFFRKYHRFIHILKGLGGN